MANTSNRICGTVLAAIVLCVHMSAATARAQMAPLVARLPAGANAVITIDVAKLLQSPIGKESELQSKLISGYADRPLAVPATAKRLAVAAMVHPVGLESIWQAAVVELSTPPRLEPMLNAQGGYLDQLSGKRAAWTPRDIFYIELDDHTLGVVRPGQRRFVSNWVAGKGATALSPYLSSALTGAGEVDSVFAVDLDGVVGLAAVKYALSMGQLPSIEKLEAGQPKLLAALGSVKGMKITMRATDKIDAEWVIDFDQDVTPLGSQVKPFVIDVLEAADLYEGNAEQWEFKVEGKRIVGKGTMDLAGMNRLLALMAPGSMEPADTKPAAPPKNEAADEPRPAGAAEPANPAAVASQKYYRSVSKILDSIGAKPSPTQSATWLLAQSRIIQQMPVLNVDPVLLEWGNMVADGFKRAAQELALGQQKAKGASLGVQSPTAYASYTDSSEGGGSDSPETRAAYRNAQQQRRQVAQAERGVAAERAFAIINEILPARGKIRVEMAQKYQVEF